jgi:enoyl-CoA hydratase/carnithine racemase
MTDQAQARTNEPLILRDDKDGITTLTLNRPSKYNALSEEMVGELDAALDALMDDDQCRVVVIAGNGKAFCAGHDLKQMIGVDDEARIREDFDHTAHMMLKLMQIPQPVIARVHGIATAAGCQLVSTCDLAVASTEATFATNGISNGLFCSSPAVPLSRNVPRKQAFEMLFTGEFIDAETAKAVGLVNRVVPPDQLDAAVHALAESIKAKSRYAVTRGKRMYYQQLAMPIEDAFGYASGIMAKDMTSADAKEGINAFLEKRKPVWRDS